VEFDIEQFRADVWYYSELEGTIKPDTWEQIVAHSVNGTRIPGDHFMADVHNDKYAFNVKSLKEQKISKTKKTTREFVQSRIPITDDRSLPDLDLGQIIIKSLDDKMQESLDYFKVSEMIDILILHRRYGNKYHAIVYKVDHPKFDTYDLTWSGGEARIGDSPSWFIKRRWSDYSHGQTCTFIKRTYFRENVIAEVTVESDDIYNISKEDIKAKYLENCQPTLNLV